MQGTRTFEIIIIRLGLILYMCYHLKYTSPGGGLHLKNTDKLINLGALKSWFVNNIYIFQCMGKIFCVGFESVPLELLTK